MLLTHVLFHIQLPVLIVNYYLHFSKKIKNNLLLEFHQQLTENNQNGSNGVQKT